LRDNIVERHFQMFCSADDVVTVHGTGECLIFHFLFHCADVDVVNAFCRTHERYRHNEAA